MNGYVRRLVDAVALACGCPVGQGDMGLLAVDAADLVRSTPADLVSVARDRGGLFRLAHEAPAAPGLRTLLLVDMEGTYDRPVWMVDGWAVIRSHGQALSLRGAFLAGADLAGADLRGADLSEADLSRTDLAKADLTGAILVGAGFAGANLLSASLKDANLTEADFSRSDLRHADLRGAVCRRTAFRGADLWGTYMWKVDVSEAFMTGADPSRSDYLAEQVQN